MSEVHMTFPPIAIIGGSGFYDMPGLTDIREITPQTPFGAPSAPLRTGNLLGHPVVFLARHGIGHTISPSEINYLANFYALKSLGVETLISVTAVGSLKEALRPRDLVIPDQYVDNTFKREKTFFKDGIVGHVSMAQPCCPNGTALAEKLAVELNIPVHSGGTYINMEGPQFSTRAESEAYRQLGFSIIGMTQAPEAKLARECEFCFIPLALVTDYDCWHESTAAVTVDMVIANLHHNTEAAQSLIRDLVVNLSKSAEPGCSCRTSLSCAIMTAPDKISQDLRNKLHPIIKKYYPPKESS
jgi:5'-methylthioadenosine phosphorylase